MINLSVTIYKLSTKLRTNVVNNLPIWATLAQYHLITRETTAIYFQQKHLFDNFIINFLILYVE